MLRILELNPYMLVALGSALGGALRYWSYGVVHRVAGETFPWGTLTVNVAGSAFIGLFAALTAAEGRFLVPPQVRLFVMPGFCGGFTTFSTFSIETLNLARDGEWSKAALNAVGSMLLCLFGVWVGHMIGTTLNER